MADLRTPQGAAMPVGEAAMATDKVACVPIGEVAVGSSARSHGRSAHFQAGGCDKITRRTGQEGLTTTNFWGGLA